MEGAAWTLPVAKILTGEETRKVLAVAKSRSARDYMFFATAANSGLRLCEVLHLKCEDYLGRGRLVITRRKKKVLRPETIDVMPDLARLLGEAKAGRDRGWLFAGGAQPCEIVRRPKFKETVCPDCGKVIADLQIFRRPGDLKRLFFTHLTQEHKQDAADVSMWIDMNSHSERQRVCDGGHTSKRELQRRWSITLELAGLKMPGRGIHSTRHGFACAMYAKTRDLRATQIALGHSSSVITERYASVLDLAEKIGSLEPML